MKVAEDSSNRISASIDRDVRAGQSAVRAASKDAHKSLAAMRAALDVWSAAHETIAQQLLKGTTDSEWSRAKGKLMIAKADLMDTLEALLPRLRDITTAEAAFERALEEASGKASELASREGAP
jgi:hypothetical protein